MSQRVCGAVVAMEAGGRGHQRSRDERAPRGREVSPSSAGSRKDPDRIIPLGLSARDRVLPVWEPPYSSKAVSWAGMLLERVILGVVAAVGLTGRTERGGVGGREKRQGHQPRSRGARGRGGGGRERREVGRRQGRQPRSRGFRGRGGGGWERRGVCAGLGVGSKAWGGPASEPRVQSAACVKALLPWRQGCQRSGWGSGSYSKAFTSLRCADENGALCFPNT